MVAFSTEYSLFSFGTTITSCEPKSLSSGIYLPTMVWKDMYDFSSDSVLLVLASTHYDATEYIRDFDDFAKEIQGENR